MYTGPNFSVSYNGILNDIESSKSVETFNSRSVRTALRVVYLGYVVTWTVILNACEEELHLLLDQKICAPSLFQMP